MKKYCSVIRVIIHTQVDQTKSGVASAACQTTPIHEFQLLLRLFGVPLPHCKCVFSNSVFLQVTCYMLNVGVFRQPGLGSAGQHRFR